MLHFLTLFAAPWEKKDVAQARQILGTCTELIEVSFDNFLIGGKIFRNQDVSNVMI